MTTLLVVGDDKIGRSFIRKYPVPTGVIIGLDQTRTMSRVIRLIWRGSLPLGAVLRMAWADAVRPSEPPLAVKYQVISSNADLLALIGGNVSTVILFRAGLIVRRDVLKAGAMVLNVHCASLTGYGGLASIYRALRDGALQQEATLHRVTERIDEGDVLDTEPYVLEKRAAYRRNEDRAYAAGMKLLGRTLERCVKGPV